MTYTTTTSYGTWCNQVNTYSTSPDADVTDFIGGGDYEWRTLMEESGALDAMQRAYRAAIEAALPDSVSLCGDEFIGPAYPEDDEWDGYPTDDYGSLDIKACVEDISLDSILEANDIVTLTDIGRFELKSKAKNPASAASQAMRRLGIKPLARVQIDGEGQPIAVYNAQKVRTALAARPGRGKRTDLKDGQ
jgi:hypothetical protein